MAIGRILCRVNSTSLRSRVALLLLLGVLLIPITTSSLRGLTHILTCEGQSNTPFAIAVPKKGSGEDPTVSSSTRIERPGKKDQKGSESPKRTSETLCGGLALTMAAELGDNEDVAMILSIENRTANLWRGTVSMLLEGTTIPVRIGEVKPGGTESEKVELNLDPGSQRELTGSLLIGP